MLKLSPERSTLLDGAAGKELIVRKGRVWITQYGDSRDIVLGQGQSFVLSFPSGVLVSGTPDAEVILRHVAHGRARPDGKSWLGRLLASFDPRWSSRATRTLAERHNMQRPVGAPHPFQ
jgi:hypothetical protein